MPLGLPATSAGSAASRATAPGTSLPRPRRGKAGRRGSICWCAVSAGSRAASAKACRWSPTAISPPSSRKWPIPIASMSRRPRLCSRRWAGHLPARASRFEATAPTAPVCWCHNNKSQGGPRMRSVSYAALALAMALAAPAMAADYKIVEKLKMPDGGWDYATSDLKNNKIYWVRNDHTDVIDTKTKKVTSLKSTGNGHMAVVVEGTSLVVIPMREPAKTNRIVDVSTDKLVADVAGAGEAPDGATYDPVSKHVYSVNHNSSDVTVVDPVAKKNVATIPVGGGKLEFAASDGAGHVFVNVQAK